MRFVSRSGRVLAALTTATATVAGATTLIPFQWENAIRLIVVIGFLGTGLYAAFWRPRLDVSDEGLTIRNVVSTHDVEWGAISRIDTKWGLTVFLGRRSISVWAAPAPGRHAALFASRDQGQHLPESTYLAGTVRPGDLITSESGGAATVVRREWERRHDDSGTLVRTRVSVPLVVGLCVLGAATAIALFF